MLMKSLFTLILCLVMGGAYGQGRDQNWYFGTNAGLRFNPAPAAPTVLSNGRLVSYEATATMSDEQGNLQLYTNAVTVWDRTHTPLPGGPLVGGFQSASQGALILPAPGNANQYYIFVVDAADNNFAAGLHYSIVDMTLRGGLGDLTATKNVAVATPAPGGRLTEKLTAVRHANGRDYWVMVHGWQNNSLYAFLLSSTGLSATPVTSTIGSVHTGGGNNIANGVGYMKASPNGQLLAVAVRDASFELFNFNNATGQLSNYRQLYTGSLRVYGVAFSLDNTKLYTTDLASDVYQFDLTTGSAYAQLIGSVAGQCGALAMGPDGRIYVAIYNTNRLGAITTPNGAGAACGFVSSFITLSGQSQIGLPNYPNVLQLAPTLAFEAAARCLPSPTSFTGMATGMAVGTTYSWNFGDPASGTANTATGLNATHVFSAPGTYTVGLQAQSPGTAPWLVTQTVKVDRAFGFSLGPDTATCLAQPLLLRPQPTPPVGAAFRWQDGTTGSTYTALNPGTYALEITYAGCTSRDEIEVTSNCAILIPNIITPDDGDQLNQSFVLKGLNPQSWSLAVFNRWGRQVYVTPSYDNRWSAASQPAGLYYYLLRNATTGQKIQGWVEVVRR